MHSIVARSTAHVAISAGRVASFHCTIMYYHWRKAKLSTAHCTKSLDTLIMRSKTV